MLMKLMMLNHKLRLKEQGKKAFGHSAARLFKDKLNRLKCFRILETRVWFKQCGSNTKMAK